MQAILTDLSAALEVTFGIFPFDSNADSSVCVFLFATMDLAMPDGTVVAFLIVINPTLGAPM